MGEGTAAGRTRRLVRWESHHDNGWTTIITEQVDGTFAAYAANRGGSGVDYVDRDIAHAHAAVMAALRHKSGHERCSTKCSDWRLQWPGRVHQQQGD